jgi:hypothetical protein
MYGVCMGFGNVSLRTGDSIQTVTRWLCQRCQYEAGTSLCPHGCVSHLSNTPLRYRRGLLLHTHTISPSLLAIYELSHGEDRAVSLVVHRPPPHASVLSGLVAHRDADTISPSLLAI